jgi:hypothetical protein
MLQWVLLCRPLQENITQQQCLLYQRLSTPLCKDCVHYAFRAVFLEPTVATAV